MNSLIKNKNKIVVRTEYSANDYFAFTIREFENVLIRNYNLLVLKSLMNYSAVKIICAIYKSSNFLKSILRKVKPDIFLFSMMMGIYESNKLCPYFLLNCNKAIYVFDAWQPVYQNLCEIIEYYDIGFVFLSAKQSCDFFKQKNIKNIYWIPEGITIQNYKFIPFQEKDIDVIQLGRKYDIYHELIVDYCETNNIIYYYEEKKGEVIFPDHDKFINVLSRTKISICIPSNITHPDRSGNVSTMTQRYLQSMASKCLVLGILPDEMKDLFDYNPIIEIDMKCPAKQLTEILKNFNSYTELIERNYMEVKNKHQWTNRADSIKNILAEKANIKI